MRLRSRFPLTLTLSPAGREDWSAALFPSTLTLSPAGSGDELGFAFPLSLWRYRFSPSPSGRGPG